MWKKGLPIGYKSKLMDRKEPVIDVQPVIVSSRLLDHTMLLQLAKAQCKTQDVFARSSVYTSVTASNSRRCWTCLDKFQSGNKLHNHLRFARHAIDRPKKCMKCNQSFISFNFWNPFDIDKHYNIRHFPAEDALVTVDVLPANLTQLSL